MILDPLWPKLAAAAMFICWLTTVVTLFQAMRLGARACAHLPKSEQSYYRLQLMLVPLSVDPDAARSLLKGHGLHAHDQAARYVHRAWTMGLAFVVGGIAMAVIASFTAS